MRRRKVLPGQEPVRLDLDLGQSHKFPQVSRPDLNARLPLSGRKKQRRRTRKGIHLLWKRTPAPHDFRFQSLYAGRQ
jgi:hypothetical protein